MTTKEAEAYELVANTCVTPARYGKVALSEIPVENLRFEDEPSYWGD